MGLPTVALLCLLVAPWQDSGLGLDALIRARRGRALPDAPSRRYGIAVWVPGLAMGVALLAAAYAKMRNSGYEWVTGAAVKYHFVEDAGRAPVDWALRLTSVEEIAVLMALFAFLVEAGFILVVLSPRPAVRLGFGLVAASLLTGFYLFQGVFWPGWWTLLLAFLPWEELYRGGLRLAGAARPPSDADAPAVPLAGALRVATLALVVLLLAQQVVVSGARAEQEPLLSSYPMYSDTWDSEEEFNEENDKFATYRFEALPPEGERVDVTARIEAIGGENALIAAAEAQAEDDLEEDEAQEIRDELAALDEAYQRRYDERLGRVYVVGQRTAGFDFERGEFDRRVVDRETQVVEPGRFEVATSGDA